jgi:hypothetical protein
MHSSLAPPRHTNAQFILDNGIEYQGLINVLGFEEIADNLLFSLSPGTIPTLGEIMV